MFVLISVVFGFLMSDVDLCDVMFGRYRNVMLDVLIR